MKRSPGMPHPSFRRKMMALVCTFGALLVLMVSFISYRWQEKQMVEQTRGQTQQVIEQLGSNIDSYVEELFRLTLAPYYNDEVMRALENRGASPEAALESRRTIEKFLSSVMILPRDEILRVYLLTEESLYSYTRTPYDMPDYQNYRETDWYREARAASGPVFIPIHAEKVFGERPVTVLSIARRIRSKEDNERILGVVKVDADHSVIKSLGDKISLAYSGGLYMSNSQGEMIYGRSDVPGLELTPGLLEQIKDGADYTDGAGNRYILNSVSLEGSGIRIVSLNAYSDIVRAAMTNMRRVILPVALSFAAALLLLVLLMRRFFKPLYRVIDAMKEVREGRLSAQVEVWKADEIGYLAESFNRMTQNLEQVMQRNTELLSEVYESNYRHKASQYEALLSQIKPHFIHNTLNTVSVLVKCGEYEDAVLCIEKLSLFLRGVMQVDKDIPLRAELELVESYLSICRVRYGDKLDFEINVPDQFLQMWIPALTVQPIVENSIKHSCEMTSRKVRIRIGARQEGGLLHIQVEDDGAGISQEVLCSIRRRMEEEEQDLQRQVERLTGNSIGLRNVHRRLRLKYGAEAGLQIESHDNHTQVDIMVPWEEKTADV